MIIITTSIIIIIITCRRYRCHQPTQGNFEVIKCIDSDRIKVPLQRLCHLSYVEGKFDGGGHFVDQFKGDVSHQFITFELWIHVPFDVSEGA